MLKVYLIIIITNKNKNKNYECNAGIINHFNLHDKIKHQSNLICNVLQSFHLCKELGKAWAILWTIEPDGCPHQYMG